MGYVLDATTIEWAKGRTKELTSAEISIGLAMDSLGGVVQDLKDGANLMDNQPDSAIIASFAEDVEKVRKDLRKTLGNLIQDKNALDKAVREYERRWVKNGGS